MRNERSVMRLAALVVTGLSLAGRADLAAAQNKLDDELGSLAKQLASYLEARQLEEIAVGSFTGPAESTAGPRIKKTLSDKLEALKIAIKRRGFSVSGDYSAMAEGGRLMALVKANVKDQLGREVFQLRQRVISDEEEVAQVFGLTFDRSSKTEDPPAPNSNAPNPPPGKSDAPPAKPDAKAQVEVLGKSLAEPRVHLEGSKVLPRAGSDFGIEVLVKGPSGEYEPRPCTMEDGMAFVELAHEEIYALRIYNNAPFDAAVAITIDGINMFAFSPVPEFRELGKMVIGRRDAPTIRGWYYDHERTREFKIASYGESAASLLDSKEGLGTITAVFCAAWDPAVEPPPPGEFGLRRSGRLTGFGKDVQSRTETVFRQFGAVRASISIRYDKEDLPPPAPPAN